MLSMSQLSLAPPPGPTVSPSHLEHTGRVKSMYSTNRYRTASAPRLAEDVVFNNMEYPGVKKSDPDYNWRSHSTQFARSGIESQGVRYTRDPLTGAWFKDRPENRKEFHHTGSVLTMRYTEQESEKPSAGGGSFRQTSSIWPAPCGRNASMWLDKPKDQPRRMIIVSTGDVSASPLMKSRSTPSLSMRRRPLTDI
mmetsp:Transcript_104944/g.182413  ORF Transcript_104944/g.182413 Transcript_104944/m.182413 type:complete len:195 (-) Transcript_104944:185-769(-)